MTRAGSARDAVLDAGVVLVLMATILSILDDTFADRTYLVAGLAPVVVLLALALAVRQLHEGGWWYTLAALMVFGPLGALAALREPGPFLVPTISSVSRVLSQSLDAPIELVSTVPPVDADGVVMLVPFLIGFLATLPAAWLALATWRPLAPVVPLVLALVATIPLGVLVPTLLVPRGIFVAVVLVAWSAIRARRREELAGRVRGSMAGAVVALLTVSLVSGLGSLLVPDQDTSDRVLLRGGGDTPDLTAVAVVPPQGRDDLRLLRATGVPEGRRLRFAALDLYTSGGWIPAEDSPGSEGYGTFKRIGHDVAPLHPGRTVVVRVELRPGYDSDWLPMLGELTSVDLDWNPGRTEVSDIRYNQATSSALVVGGVDVRDRYSFESVVVDDGFTRSDATREPAGDQGQVAGAFLDRYLGPFDRPELLPLERVLLLGRYLRDSGTVRLVEGFDQSPAELGRGMLGSDRITGTSFQYSALTALGAARLGVPARVVLGAEPGRKGLVTYGDVTSWVELQFADGTWRTLEPARYTPSEVEGYGSDEPVPTEPGRFVQGQLDNAAKGRDKEIRLDAGTTDTGSEDEAVPAWRSVLLAVAGLVALMSLALILVPVVKVLRRGRRRRTSSWSGIYVNGWQEVLDAARDRGTPVSDGWSRVAQATELGAGLDLARRADAAVFAPAPGDPADGSDFWRECQDLRRRLLAEPDARRRLRAHLDPASLLASWARRRASGRQVRHEDRRAGGQQPTGA
ncbi:transglutaminaseTgpA domain-containing protein [Nocardioides hwasunensis]|uniref:Transglutaminase domain-containing protein n=1 Tax=Nocardioides hwasunensis TaxID=397258 RepID=A0ABR8MJD8_9ACTN|nr:transglutaminaseTgpA domain-containing protein [Nocardioides hwasunensis]MBD3914609.1 hypothetical protein [Nocardioides hwasunensis]